MSDLSRSAESPNKVFGSIIYECERCGTKQSLEQLSEQPEIRCINCGYRVLKKVRPPVVKNIEHAV
ncbi:MAG: RNA polymerase Rbp10 [archaeon]|jgi:DNA-directed RNA polymerase subunit RPC12/RpoP|nr:RNA polymerase Rbp10 [archaeon]